MKWVLIVLGVLAGAVAAIVVAGYALPARHIASANRLVLLDLIDTAARIRDVERYPAWRKGVEISDVVRDGSRVLYTESRDGDSMRLALSEREQGRVYVSTILSEDLPYSGEWVIALAPEEGGVRVTIVETGEVRNPIYRFMSAFVIGHTATMNEYLDELAATGIAQG